MKVIAKRAAPITATMISKWNRKISPTMKSKAKIKNPIIGISL
jgi:hypothetical protein